MGRVDQRHEVWRQRRTMVAGGMLIALVQLWSGGPAWARHPATTTTVARTTSTSVRRTTTTVSRTTTTVSRTTTTTVPVTTTVPMTTTTTIPATTTTTIPGGGPTVGGYDISWPQCAGGFPTKPAFGIVGASDGLAFSDNPCLAAEYQWAASAPAPPGLYLNTADPGSASVHWTAPGPKTCSGTSGDLGCAYNYGWNAASHAYAYAATQTSGAPTPTWWLDIETANTWSSNTAANDADIQGMVDYFGSVSAPVGVYSTAFQWGQITGGLVLDIPSWVAGAVSASEAASWCTPTFSFTGGPVRAVQYPVGNFDGDVSC